MALRTAHYLLIVQVLKGSFDLHVLMRRVGQNFFDSELERFPGDSEILDVVILEPVLLLFLFLGIEEGLDLERIVHETRRLRGGLTIQLLFH